MLAIIPARGGSKGLPNKNIKLLNGKPLIVHTIEVAKRCSQITCIFVSTDCPRIAKIAEEAGAWVPELRPDELATDEAKSIDVYLYTLNYLKEAHKLSFEEMVILQPTSPLRTVFDLDNAINIFRLKNADSVISFTIESHPVFWNKLIDEDGRIGNIFDDNSLLNRQCYMPTYFPNGAIYIFRTIDLARTLNYYSGNAYAYIMPKNRSVDIDDIYDFKYVQVLMGDSREC